MQREPVSKAAPQFFVISAVILHDLHDVNLPDIDTTATTHPIANKFEENTANIMSIERDPATSDAHEYQQRRRTRPARSPSLTKSRGSSLSASSPASKRSPSPIVTFHPAPLSAETPKGVKNITRKVIKRLEGLGHLEIVDMDLSVPEEDEIEGEGEEREVERALYAIGREAVKQAAASKHSMNGNGTGNGHVEQVVQPKPDFEIPRKVLHSSIGALILWLHPYHV